MRKDYKYLLVDAGHHREWSTSKKVRDDDMDATRAPMRNHNGWGRNFRDYLSPLYRCLHKQVGRPWNKVFSELCESADSKSMQGLHLRDHIWDVVVKNCDVVKTEKGYRRKARYSWRNGLVPFRQDELFVDDHGILRKPKPKECRPDRSYEQHKEQREKLFKPLTDTSAHIYFSGGWWYVEWQNYNADHDDQSMRNRPWIKGGKYLLMNWDEDRYELVSSCRLDLAYNYRTGGWNGNQPNLIFPTMKRQLSRYEIKSNRLAA